MLAGTWLGESFHNDNKILKLNPHQAEFVHQVKNRISSIPLHRLVKFLKSAKHRPPIKNIWLKDPLGDWLIEGSQSKELQKLDQKSKQQKTVFPMVLRTESALFFGPVPVQLNAGEFYLFIKTDLVKPLDTRSFLDNPLIRLLLLIFASIAAATITSKFVTSPIKQLQKTVQIVPQDLSVRVLPKLLARKDELGNLSRQIEHMIETIEKLLKGQQQILWDVSHELRSPLARIQTTIAIAEQQKQPEKAFKRLNEEVNQLNHMISQLLLLGRINADINTINKQNISLKELIQQICEDMKLETENCPKFNLHIDDQIDIYGDPLLLASVFGNLMRNARDHNETPVTVTISAKSEKNPISSWKFREFLDFFFKFTLLQRPFFSKKKVL